MRVLSSPLVLLLLGLPAAASAQAPQIITQQPPAVQAQLNIERVEINTPIELTWQASAQPFGQYSYEVTYDRARTSDTSTVTLVRLDDAALAGRPSGPLIPGQQYSIRIRPQQILPAGAIPGMGRGAEGERNIVIRVFREGGAGFFESSSFSWRFQYDTLPPDPPTITEVLPGERRLQVGWRPPARDTDVSTYQVFYCPNVSTSTITSGDLDALGPELPCDDPLASSNFDRTQTSAAITTGLQNDVAAVLAVRSTDPFGNVSVLSELATGTPLEVTDYWELYRREGGAEEGGFCFIATAAYGSYAHPAVQVLRAFRDRVLGQSAAGKLVVWAYYQASPPMAAAVAADPSLAGWTRAALVPVALLALVCLAAPLLLLGGLGLWLFRRVGRRARATAAAAGAALLILGLAPPAQAFRPESSLRTLGVAFEFRGGPSLPALADEQGGPENNDAFLRIFGSDPRPLYNLGAELQLYRGVGTLGVGGSFGFMQWVGRSLFGPEDATSKDTTVFNILPLTLTAVYRFDYFLERASIPFVPYVRGGLAYYVWWVTQGTGEVARAGEAVGRGGKFGLTGSLGISFLLNALEPTSAGHLFSTTGIRGTYLFAEVNALHVDGFGARGFDFSDLTWNLGLMLEM